MKLFERDWYDRATPLVEYLDPAVFRDFGRTSTRVVDDSVDREESPKHG